MKNFDVVGFGALNVDLINKISSTMLSSELSVQDSEKHAGGSAGNTICALSKFNIKCASIGRIGNDDNGKFLINSFRKHGVDYTHVSKDTYLASGISHSFVDGFGNRTIYTSSQANKSIKKQHINLDFLASAQWVHFSDFVDEEQNEIEIQVAQELDRNSKTSLWLDHHILKFGYSRLKKVLPYIHTLFIKEPLVVKLLDLNSRDGAAKLLDEGCQEIIVVHNPFESELFTQSERYHLETRHTNVVDATGISGAYVAGYLYGQIQGFHLKQSMLLGNVMMSFCAEKLGCRSNFPDLKQLIRRSFLFKTEKNVLIVGNGGREHAIAWKLNQSNKIHRIYVAPGNGGIAEIAQNVPISSTDIKTMKKFVKENNIDITIVGPEVPLSKGIADEFEADGLPLFGPTKKAAILEYSKTFAKNFMRKFKIPTAEFKSFIRYKEAVKYLNKIQFPIVVKADGLASGKGVFVCQNVNQALNSLHKIMVDKIFGNAGKKVIIEEFLTGEEASVLAFTDGEHVVPLLPAQDHKPINDDDQGPNTGGMGAYAPAPIVTPHILETVMNRILKPTIQGMKSIGRTYKGVIYAGLMLTKSGPKVLEFNCRFGDPETQAILPLLKSDLMDIIEAILLETLKESDVSWERGYCNCVIVSSKGYPEKSETGKIISGFNDMKKYTNADVFHSGTQSKIITSGGRVLGVFSKGKTLEDAIKKSYQGVKKVFFENMHHRNDIGKKGVRYLKGKNSQN